MTASLTTPARQVHQPRGMAADGQHQIRPADTGFANSRRPVIVPASLSSWGVPSPGGRSLTARHGPATYLAHVGAWRDGYGVARGPHPELPHTLLARKARRSAPG